MHEWALAESVVETVRQEMESRKNPKVEKVTLLFGELQSIDREIFREGLDYFLSEDIPVTGDVFVIKDEPALFVCNKCSGEWTLKAMEGITEEEREAIHFLPESAHVYISCPECGSPDFRIERGRGVSIASIEFIEEKEA